MTHRFFAALSLLVCATANAKTIEACRRDSPHWNCGGTQRLHSDGQRLPASTMISFVRVKYWEIIADNLSKAGWSWGCVSAIDSKGRTIWVADAHRGDGKRFVVRADEKLRAFLELEPAIRSGRTPRGLRAGKNKARRTVADHLKASSITSSDSFTLSSARLNKPQIAGSSLRHRLARSPRSNWIPRVSRSEPAVQSAS
jgi:hypothetical protein